MEADRRPVEVALTLATLVLVLVSSAGERLGLPAAVHLAVDLGSYVAGGWFAVALRRPACTVDSTSTS